MYGYGILFNGWFDYLLYVNLQSRYIIMVQFLMGVGVVGKPYMFAC